MCIPKLKNPIFSLLILMVFTSCNGQVSSETIHAKNAVKGKIVTELGSNIMVIYQDKKNNYWFGSHERGLYKYDGKAISHFTTKNGLPHNRIEEIKEDKSGNIYCNTYGGFSKFDGQNFVTLKEIIATDWVLNADDLWFKSPRHSGQVYRYDGKNLYLLQIPKTQLGEDYVSKNPTYPNPYGIYTIYKDSKGSIWFGTGTLGACRYNGKTFDWISEDDVTEFHDRPANGIRSIIEDKDGYFWFNSIFRYDIYNTKWKSFYLRENGIGSLDGKKDGNLNEYLSITKDNNQALWIATYNEGVYQYDGKSITHYSVLDNGSDITLFSIYKDNNGNLWLSTHTNGALKFNGGKFEKFTIAQ